MKYFYCTLSNQQSINVREDSIYQTNIFYLIIFFSEAATKVMIDLLGTYTEDNASQAKNDAHRYVGFVIYKANKFRNCPVNLFFFM